MTITGHELQHELTATARTLAEAKGIAIKFAGNAACTDGKYIQLPAVDQTREFTPDEVKILRGYVDHEAAHVTDTELALMDTVIAKHGKNAGVLMNAIEDMRIERKAIERLPRVKANLDAVGSHIATEGLEEYVPTLHADAATAITWQGRADAGYAVDAGTKLLARMQPREREVIQRYASRLNALTSTRDSLALALELIDELTQPEPEPQPQPPSNGQGEPEPQPDADADESSDTQSDADESGDTDADADMDTDADMDADESGDTDADMDADADESGDESDTDADESGDTQSDASEGNGQGSESDADAPTESDTDADADANDEGAGGWGPGTSAMAELELKSADIGDAIEELLAHESEEDEKPQREIDESLLIPTVADSALDAVVSIEESVVGADHRYANAMLDDMEGHLNAVSQRLARLLLAYRPRRWEGGQREGRLNARRLSQIPRHTTDRVWSKRKPSAAMDTAVLLLVDCSASMRAKVNGGTVQRIEIASRAALAMTIGLQRAGVATKVAGFNTAYVTNEQANANSNINFDTFVPGMRTSCHTIHVVQPWNGKRINRTTDSIQNFNRLAHAANAANADGDAIMWARAELARRPEQRKVLIVLSDGQPADGRMGGEHYLKNAVQGTLDADIECVGIGIGCDYVKEYYPHHVVINSHISELPDILMGELGAMLKPKANQR